VIFPLYFARSISRPVGLFLLAAIIVVLVSSAILYGGYVMMG
jgi:hypothetical protein